MKRWVDDGTIAADRTAGGHRRIPIAAAVRFIRRHRLRPPRPEVILLSSAPALGPVDPEAADACYDALLNDDAERARSIILGRYVSGADIATISDSLIRPVMERLGELWKSDSHGILIEHRAVDTCVRALTDLRSWLPSLPKGARAAIAAAGPGDPYTLPTLLATMTLHEQGSDAHNVGPSTPLETIGLAAERYGAAICSLSVSISQDRKRHAEWMRLADCLDANGTRLVVGGRYVKSLPDEFLCRARTCGSMVELGSYAAGVLEGIESGHKSHDRSKP